jgi:hypothetical protein
MPKPCSLELRDRVGEAVKSGASRREAAERFAVSPSSAIKWMQRQHESGSIAPKPSGGSISPLEVHADFLLVLIADEPDLTLDEIVAAIPDRGRDHLGTVGEIIPESVGGIIPARGKLQRSTNQSPARRYPLIEPPVRRVHVSCRLSPLFSPRRPRRD